MRTSARDDMQQLLLGKYRYNEIINTEIPIPDDIMPYLPDTDLIYIDGYGDSTVTNGRRRLINPNDEYSDGAYIQYSLDHSLTRSAHSDPAMQVFLASNHPFISRFSNIEDNSAEFILKEIVYKPNFYEVTKNKILVQFDSGYYYTNYIETPDYIKYNFHYQDSYHDGGGSGSTEWILRKASIDNADDELQHEKEIDNIKIPDCKGYMIDDGHLYLFDPWGLTGIFEYYKKTSYQYDYLSEEETNIIGKPYNGNKKDSIIQKHDTIKSHDEKSNEDSKSSKFSKIPKWFVIVGCIITGCIILLLILILSPAILLPLFLPVSGLIVFVSKRTSDPKIAKDGLILAIVSGIAFLVIFILVCLNM